MFSSAEIMRLNMSIRPKNHPIDIVDEKWFFDLLMEDTDKFRRLMHMSGKTFMNVCEKLQQIDVAPKRKYRNTVLEKYGMAAGMLYILQKSTVSSNAQLFKMSKTQYLRCVRRISDLLLENYNNIIKIPDIQHQRSFSQLPGCLYCLDGTYITKSNQILNGLTYLNRKGYQSLNSQIMCDEYLNIVYSYCNYPGRTSDSFAFKNSDFYGKIENLLVNESYILADNGYENDNRIITPYKMYGDLTVQQTTYNYHHSHFRMKIENLNASLKGRCTSLMYPHNRIASDCQTNFYAAVCLHQMCNDEESVISNTDTPCFVPIISAITDTREKVMSYINSNFNTVTLADAIASRINNRNNTH